MNDAAKLQPASPALLSRAVGSTIADKYVLLEQIGTGSMGSVYRARHTSLERDVALKLMAPELACDPSFSARFRREAHAASRLAHPSSVLITDFGEEPDGLLYLVMEYVRGQSLESMIEGGAPLGEQRIVDILSQVLSAVAVAHEAGIVHRDLKPANVLVVETLDDDGEPTDVVKVCDFGVASLRDRAELLAPRSTRPGSGDARWRQLTMAGAVVGTPAYMAPEQAAGRVQDARTDLYSLGIVLFEMLTRRLPISGSSLEEIMWRQIHSPAPSPRDVVDCTPALAAVCQRALAKNPEERFESARAMRAALRAALEPEVTVMPSEPLVPAEALGSLAGVAAIREAGAEPKRSRTVWPWLVAAAAAGAMASITWLSHGRPHGATAQQLVDRVEALVPASAQLTSADLSVTPERAPLATAPVPVAPGAPDAPVAEAPARSRAEPAHRGRGKTRAVQAHGDEPLAEVAVAETEAAAAPAAAAVEAPVIPVVPEASAEEPAPRDTDGVWSTRH